MSANELREKVTLIMANIYKDLHNLNLSKEDYLVASSMIVEEMAIGLTKTIYNNKTSKENS